MASFERFFVYVISDNGEPLGRMLTDVPGVFKILSERGRSGIASIVRSSTSQKAFLLGDTVAWTDVDDLSMEEVLAKKI